MNNLDKTYTALLQDILDNGVEKKDRTGTGTLSVFGRQIRHKMSEGFPLLTTKKMHWKSIVTELIWFLRGDTNIKYLVDNDCHIWDGDAYKAFEKWKIETDAKIRRENPTIDFKPLVYESKEEFINKIKTDDEFAKKWGNLGSIYGKQWRSWTKYEQNTKVDGVYDEAIIDQIQNLINDLKTNPDSRRLMVNAWAVHDLPNMVLPPCHYGFQVYTRELSDNERINLYERELYSPLRILDSKVINMENIPRRAISLMWNQRSVDTFLGLPFNIASYGLLLEIIAKEVNMVPDELIGNLGDVHLYLNHVEQAKQQIGRGLTLEERSSIASSNHYEVSQTIKMMVRVNEDTTLHKHLDEMNIPKRTREPFPLPTLKINTEFWQTESGECGVGPLKTNLQGFEISDFVLENYQSHPTIKAPLSN